MSNFINRFETRVVTPTKVWKNFELAPKPIGELRKRTRVTRAAFSKKVKKIPTNIRQKNEQEWQFRMHRMQATQAVIEPQHQKACELHAKASIYVAKKGRGDFPLLPPSKPLPSMYVITLDFSCSSESEKDLETDGSNNTATVKRDNRDTLHSDNVGYEAEEMKTF